MGSRRRRRRQIKVSINPITFITKPNIFKTIRVFKLVETKQYQSLFLCCIKLMM
jgi:hypothetical protein